jgi:hypothetical protein
MNHMNPLDTQHKQDLERHERRSSASPTGGAAPALLGAHLDDTVSLRAGVRRSVEGKKKIWLDPIQIGSAVLKEQDFTFSSGDHYVFIWCDVTFGVGADLSGNPYNDGDIQVSATWGIGSMDDYEFAASNTVVLNGDDLYTGFTGSAKATAQFGIVVAEIHLVDGQHLLQEPTAFAPTLDSFIPYRFRVLIPDFSATPPFQFL